MDEEHPIEQVATGGGEEGQTLRVGPQHNSTTHPADDVVSTTSSTRTAVQRLASQLENTQQQIERLTNSFTAFVSRAAPLMESGALLPPVDPVTHRRPGYHARYTDVYASQNYDEPPPVPQASNNHFRQSAPVEPRAGRRTEFATNPIDPALFTGSRRKTTDLLPFSGDPADWPTFICHYQNTTIAENISDLENIGRLQRALSGVALAMVFESLRHPDNLILVIQTLERYFGQAHFVIDQTIQRILDMASPDIYDLVSIIAFSTEVDNMVSIISNMNEYRLGDATLLASLVRKLPAPMKMQWSPYSAHGNSVRDFSVWLRRLATDASQVLDTPITMDMLSRYMQPRTSHAALPGSSGQINTSSSSSNLVRPGRNSSANFHSTSSRTRRGVNVHQARATDVCSCCENGSHSLEECNEFKGKSRTERWSFMRNDPKRRCFACLREGHSADKCKFQSVCGFDNCDRNHHPLLHKPSESASVNHHRGLGRSVLYKVIPVQLVHGNNRIQILALLDGGSSVTLLHDKVYQQLGLVGSDSPLSLEFTGHTTREEPHSKRVTVQIQGIRAEHRIYTLRDVQTVQSLGLARQTVNVVQIKNKYPHLEEADLDSYENEQPTLLIGLGHHHIFSSDIILETTSDEPAAMRTPLGWVVYGPANVDKRTPLVCFHKVKSPSNAELHDQVKAFMTVESFGTMALTSLLQSKDEKRAVSIFSSKTKLTEDGRYETGLLWAVDNVHFPSSYDMALSRLRALERKMSRDPSMRNLLSDRIDEYTTKGYVRKLTQEEAAVQSQRMWYTPYSIVVNRNKEPPKLRMVYDFSASVNNISLNSYLLKGPPVLSELVGILLQFRERNIGVTGDIKEMFLRVKVREEDHAAMRFLYRTNPDNVPDTYVLQVVPFGATCSPYLAQAVKNLNAARFEDKFAEAVHAIVHKHYVDDLLISFDHVDDAIRVVNDVRFIHAQGGFEIRGFHSNAPAVESSVQESNPQIDATIELGESHAEKVLGIWWDKSEDTILFKVNKIRVPEKVRSFERPPTKRELLSIVASIYDPLGLLGNFMAAAKIVLKNVWASGVDWDSPIKPANADSWQVWWRTFQDVNDLRIPRVYVSNIYLATKIELHTFVDASKDIFAAVCYLRVEIGDQVSVSLIGSKSRSAPVKPISIPRLELQAAVLGTRLTASMRKHHSITIDETMYWSDSSTVLAWLSYREPSQLKQFTALRVGEILESTEVNQWHYVPTHMNVADEATKWSVLPTGKFTSRWWSGPPFLLTARMDWKFDLPQSSPEIEELKGCHLNISNECPTLLDVKGYSSWIHLRNTVAFVMRFVRILRNRVRQPRVLTRSKAKEVNITSFLMLSEIKAAELWLWRLTQKESFGNDMETMALTRKLPSSSKLQHLSPFSDGDGIIRMRGRIEYTPLLPDATKYPIILDEHHYVTFLIIKHYHEVFHHQSNEAVVAELRLKFWIPSIRTALRSVKSRCQVCKNERAKVICPQMAALPQSRLAGFTNAFTHTGVDAFGPYLVKQGRAFVKRYGLVFTCLTFRAVFVELVHDLSTDSFLMAFQNFRNRNLCSAAHMYSDNGRNFVGAARCMQASLKDVDHDQIGEKLSQFEVQWHFNPPETPHMGGAWERQVRSIKAVLQRLLQDRTVREDVLRSFLVEAENVINRQPLTYMTMEDGSGEPLTPLHFTRQFRRELPQSPPLTMHHCHLTKQYQLAQELADHFWRRWVLEYLPEITKRTKWHQSSLPLKQGDVVLIVDPNAKRNAWKMGIVETTNVGDGKQVRSAVIRTSTGRLTRPVVRLAKLDVNQEKQ